MEVYWTPEAIRDRTEVYEYIEARNPAAALTIDALFSEQAIQLADHPQSGRSGRVFGTQEVVVHKHYMMVYDISGDQVRVLNVVHTAKQWPVPDHLG